MKIQTRNAYSLKVKKTLHTWRIFNSRCLMFTRRKDRREDIKTYSSLLDSDDKSSNIFVCFGSSVFRQVIGIPMSTNSAPLLADLFLHTFEYDFMVKTMKHDITKAIQFSNTYRYIDDLFSINNVDFGNYISAIYPPELQLTDTLTSSLKCVISTHIKTGGTNTPFRIRIYDKRDDFTIRIVNFPHMDSNIPANPADGVYISQLVRYARICTSKVDFMNRLRGLSLRLRQQGFLTNLLQRSFTKFFNRHGLIIQF